MSDNQLTLTEHLEDLRRVLIVSILSVFVVSMVAFMGFRDLTFQLITQPMQDLGLSLIFISPLEGLVVKFKISMFVGLIVALPVILWQVWSFILPALEAKEKHYLVVLTPLSVIMFLIGAGFAYTTVFRFAIRFLLLVGGEGLTPMISVNNYIGFMLAFILPFGIIFELPLVVFLLSRLGLVTPAWLAAQRKIALVVIVALAAVATPGPDVISQLLMAGPMYLLYEVSIWIAYLVHRRSKAEAEADDEGDGDVDAE